MARPSPVVILLLLLPAGASCSAQHAGVDRGVGTPGDAAAPDDALGYPGADVRIRPDTPPVSFAPTDAAIPFLAGDPLLVGCSDGTREGFLDLSAGGWPAIAGCAGAWSVPGLVGGTVAIPQCGRRSGDSSGNVNGFGCGVADLCAPGWHVCGSPGEIESKSLSDCEAAVPRGVLAFFAAATAAGPVGTCAADVTLTNDLHGCGSFGQPESEGCFPLDRRLDFAGCRDTLGVWRCGDADHHLEEGVLVTKTAPRLGGVLCCRDP